MKLNSWKNSLLRELYHGTRQALLRGLQNPQERDELIQNKQAGARHLLRSEGLDPERVNQHWSTLSLEDFLQRSWEEIAWETKMVLTAQPADMPLVLLRTSSTRGGTEVFLYGPDRDNLFALTTSQLDQLGLNVVNAHIETADTGHTMNSFLVLEQDGNPVEIPGRKEEIKHALRQALVKPVPTSPMVQRRIPRKLKHFSTPTRIDFELDTSNQRTIMKLVTDDRPGLLSLVGQAFTACGIRLNNAKIATIGAEAEDTFFITDQHNRPLREPGQFDCLEKTIGQLLAEHHRTAENKP